MRYVVQKNSTAGNALWMSRAAPALIWGDKRHAMLFETRALAQMAAQAASRFEPALEVVFVPDTTHWRS